MSETAKMEWATNASLSEIADRLRGVGRVCVLTHAKADGDALGSTVALVRTLRRMGKEAVVVFEGPFPERFAGFVDEGEAIFSPDEDGSAYSDARVSGAELVVICDTGARSQLRASTGYIESMSGRVALVDHHRSGDAELATWLHVDTSASAACVLVAELCVELLGVGRASALPVEVAQVLYLGTGTDTGWFRHSNVDARTMRLAADLLDAGVDADELVRASEYADPPERLEVMKRALAGLRVIGGGQGAVMSLSMADLEAAGVTAADTGGLVDIPRGVRTIRVVALVIENEEGAKISFRSKAGADPVDVSALAGTHGGGGHFHAAGMRLKMPLVDAVEEVVSMIERAVSQ